MKASRICLGTAQLGMDYGVANRGGRPNEIECHQLLEFALQNGVTCWDTAPAYGDAESRIGSFLQQLPEDPPLQLVSKLPSVPQEISPGHIKRWVASELRSSLERLKAHQLTAWLAHHPGSVLGPGAPVWEAMREEQARGRVGSIGVSVYSPEEVRRALELPGIGAIQLVLNLLDTRVLRERVLASCVAQGITVFARSAFLQGVFALDESTLPQRLHFLREPLSHLRRMLAEYNLTPTTAAIPFVLSRPEIDYLVLGVDGVEQLKTNLLLAERPFPPELTERLLQQFATLDAHLLEPRYWPPAQRDKP